MNFNLGQNLIGGWFEDGLDWLLTQITDLLGVYIDAYFDFFAHLFYVLFLGIARILDLIQMLFRKLAGLDAYKIIGESTATEGDIVIGIITSDAVMNILLSLSILAVVLLFITTFVAVIKNEYASFGGKYLSISKIIGKSLRAIFNFVSVPVVVVLALIVSNGLLRSLDLATAPEQSVAFSNRVFVTAAYNCNRARFDEDFLDSLTSESGAYEVWYDGDPEPIIVTFPNGVNAFGIFTDEDTAASDIDNAFAQELAVPAGYEDSFATNQVGFDIMDILGIGMSYPDTFSIYNARLVWYYYDLSAFNFIVGFGLLIGFAVIFGQTMLGLIKRLFSLAILFMISPLITALAPVNEEAFKGWKKAFIGDALNAYSVIVVLNLFMMLIPVIGNIQFFPIASSAGEAETLTLEALNYMAQMLILLGGAVFFKDFTKTLSGLIGAGDAFGEGAGKAKDFASLAAKSAVIGGVGAKAFLGANKAVGKTAVSPFKAANEAWQSSKALGEGAGKRFGSMAKASLAAPFKHIGGGVKNFLNATDEKTGEKIGVKNTLKQRVGEGFNKFKTSSLRGAMPLGHSFFKAVKEVEGAGKAYGEKAKKAKDKQRNISQRQEDVKFQENMLNSLNQQKFASVQQERDNKATELGEMTTGQKYDNYLSNLSVNVTESIDNFQKVDDEYTKYANSEGATDAGKAEYASKLSKAQEEMDKATKAFDTGKREVKELKEKEREFGGSISYDDIRLNKINHMEADIIKGVNNSIDKNLEKKLRKIVKPIAEAAGDEFVKRTKK